MASTLPSPPRRAASPPCYGRCRCAAAVASVSRSRGYGGGPHAAVTSAPVRPTTASRSPSSPSLDGMEVAPVPRRAALGGERAHAVLEWRRPLMLSVSDNGNGRVSLYFE
uniref:Uncharacterized protein n=1 Tax=Leersia perrieri TaxID=77586 RepID=A0A0D9V008_9ORYZ